MSETITIQIDKAEFFKNWEPEQINNLSEEDKEEIIKFFINRNVCIKRDNLQCQNKNCTQEYNLMPVEERRKYMSCHHIIAKRDFKLNPRSMEKRLGYGCNDLENLTTLCKPCHKGYERAKITLLLNGQEYRLERPASVDLKKVVKEGKELRKEMKRLGKYGWGKLTQQERVYIIYLLMKWLDGDVLYELSD